MAHPPPPRPLPAAAHLDRLTGLNPAQRQAVEQVRGPLLVLAGAGSGKTRVLTHRIAHLIDTAGVPPGNILAVTFTNKAAEEMRQRLRALIGDDAERLWIGTFHSVCARLLRYEAKAFGIHSGFTIYDEDDRRALLRRVVATLDLSEKDLPVRQLASQISAAKNAMVDVDTFAQEAAGSPSRCLVARVYAAYEQGLRANKACDFDDLIVEPVRHLQRNPEVLQKYRQRFRYILIDEYQDTNRPQYLLARMLAAEHRNLCVVGDDDQSIYQFRGADIRNILDFEKDYPEAVVVRLEQNYRSTGHILAAANAVIDNNRDRKGKRLWTAGEAGERLQVAECGDDRAEARHVVAAVRERVRREGFSLSHAAILYRANAQSRQLEEELRRQAVPYTVVGGVRFYERKEIKDALAYLRLLVNPADDISALRVINSPKRGIGESTVERLAHHARSQGVGIMDAVHQAERVEGLASRAASAVTAFGGIVSRSSEALAAGLLTLPELGGFVLEGSGYLADLAQENTPEAQARLANLDSLVSGMADFAARRDPEAEGLGLDEFLAEVALMTSEDEAQTEGGEGALTLMTLHSAKGLEFQVVAICGLEEEVFPTMRAVEEGFADPRPIEEERRLLYVGITRARRHLLLAWSGYRYLFGAGRPMQPSRFLGEIPPSLVEAVQVRAERDWGTPAGAGRRARRGAAGGGGTADRSSPAPVRRVDVPRAPAPQGVHYVPDDDAEATSAAGHADGADALTVGRWVLHPTWGRGQILDREGTGIDTKLSVRFGPVTKRLVAAYAQLQPA